MLKKNKIVLLTGSNIGDSKGYLNFALNKINAEIGTIVKVSGFYKTAAWGNENQNSFLNQVIVVKSYFTAEEVLQKIMLIEAEAKRIRTVKYAPRTLDIDILFYNNDIINLPNLTIPHTHLHKRMFTLVPLVEILPNYKHPLIKKSMRFLLKHCEDNLVVEKIAD